MTKQQQYPYQDGDVTVLGPRVFVSNDGKVISWRGVNYVPHPDQGFTVPDEPQTASAGYCPACGRGDVAPTPEEYEQQRQRAEQAVAALAHVQALADEYPVAIDTARIHEALDTPGNQHPT